MFVNLRSLALALLDDDEGINEKAWEILKAMLLNQGHYDIVQAVRIDANGKLTIRCYLSEDAAEALKIPE